MGQVYYGDPNKTFRPWWYTDQATGASAVLTGTTVPTATAAEIVTGGQTTIITLTGDTWVTAGAAFNAQRQAIIDGCDSGQSEANGWDAVVKATQGVAGVVRTSDTVVTITWDAFATYSITSNETITVTVPAAALTGAVALVATPTFGVLAVAAVELSAFVQMGFGPVFYRAGRAA
jgi:hypothetical protein